MWRLLQSLKSRSPSGTRQQNIHGLSSGRHNQLHRATDTEVCTTQRWSCLGRRGERSNFSSRKNDANARARHACRPGHLSSAAAFQLRIALWGGCGGENISKKETEITTATLCRGVNMGKNTHYMLGDRCNPLPHHALRQTCAFCLTRAVFHDGERRTRFPNVHS